MSPVEVYTTILAVCGAIITVSSAATVIIKAIKAAKAPEQIHQPESRLLMRKTMHNHLNLEGDGRTVGVHGLT